MSRVNQNKHGKFCEKFVSELRNVNANSYKTFVSMMNKYNRKQLKVQDVLSQLTNLIQDKGDLVTTFNNLVHPDLKIQEKENSKEELNKVFSKIFAALKKDFPDQFEHVVQLFANTAKKNLKKEEGEAIYMIIGKLFTLVQTDPDIQCLSPEIIEKINDVLIEIRSEYHNQNSANNNYPEEYEDYDNIEQEYLDSRGKLPNKGFNKYSERNVIEEEPPYQPKDTGPKTESQFFEYIAKILTPLEYKCL